MNIRTEGWTISLNIIVIYYCISDNSNYNYLVIIFYGVPFASKLFASPDSNNMDDNPNNPKA